MDTNEFEQFDPTGAGTPSHLLVVEDDPDYADLLTRSLDANQELPVTHDLVGSLEQALDAVDAGEHDLILLDLHLPDERGLRTLRRLRDRSAQIPIVVLTAADSPDLAQHVISAGAQEYLRKDEFTPTLLAKSIRNALERWRLYDALHEARETATRERELRELERLATRPQGSVTAASFAQGPLASRHPAQYRELRDEYERLLAQGLRERAYRTRETATRDLRSLASVLGFLNAGPRDVVDLHTDALRRQIAHSSVGMHQPLAEEGRIRVLELMGYLASYYRSRAIVASRGKGVRREGDAKNDGKDGSA